MWHFVCSQDIVNTVKDALHATGTNSHSYKRSKIRSHSLCSGGAMALFINGYDAFTIQ